MEGGPKKPRETGPRGFLKDKIPKGNLAFDLLIVEILPVLEVVEVNGVKDRSGVSNADGGKDGATGGVIVIVTNNSSVVLVDRCGVQRSPFLVEDPLLALRVGRLAGLDVVEEGFAFDAEGIEGHLVESGSGSGVVGVKLTGGIERCFLPESWKVKHAERTCDSGSDERNDFAHF